MQVLVTGGGGYLGCCLVAELLGRGHRVRIFDRFCFGEESVESFRTSKECEIVKGDVRRLQERPGLLDGVEAIAHLASLSNDPSCDLNPDMAHDVNVESTRELASLAIQKGVRRFLLASSCVVYGRGLFDWLDEESPTNPVSTFGATKLEAERAILSMNSDYFEPMVARTASMFGVSPRMRFDLAVNQMVASAVRSKKITIVGGGRQWRPMVHVRDAARAFAILLETPKEHARAQVFNVGSDENNFQILHLAQRIAQAFSEVALEVPKSDDDLRSYRVHFGKLGERLDFECRYSLDDGLRELREALQDPAYDPLAEPFFNVRRMRRLLSTPVDEGGEPVAPRFIPLARPSLGEEEEQAVVDTLRSGWLTTGPKVQIFERMFAEIVSARYVVATSSCTAALHLCLAHLNVGPGDEVITSPLTWASTGNTILRMGAKPVFVDICPDTLNLDPAKLESALTERTKAIMPVHLAGQPCDMDAIRRVAERRRVPVIGDAAHALGAAYKNRPVGSDGDFTCFSFYPIKNVTTVEGGVIAVQRESDAEHLRRLATNGMTSIAWNRYGRSAVAGPAQVMEPGFKYHMNDVGAAIGIEQLRKFPSFKAARRRLARMYCSVLSDLDEIVLPKVRDDVEHAWHLMIVRLRLDKLIKSRDEIAHELRRENIGTGVHFYGLHLHEYYQKTLGNRPEDLPHATAASREILSLPLYPLMTDKNLHDVVEALKKVLAHAKKK
ncbi:MAG: aminotransferase class I/II-fold pyridoxal phosphate-dependent enzyme [Candidatus Hydrogenedentes bacterium]|nr:aminotransferase class I/II-fold pyridoxal phosphate-dependent enzyme [Candidatus Hydrogenedentota bacterium]